MRQAIKNKREKIVYFLIFFTLLPLMLKKNIQNIIFENVILNLKYVVTSKYKEGRMDIPLYEILNNSNKNISQKGEIYIGSLYKTDEQEWINIRKERLSSDKMILSNHENLFLSYNTIKDSIVGSIPRSDKDIFFIMYNGPGLVKINELKADVNRSLLILTKFDYYKNLFGIPLLSGFIICVFIINYFSSKKISKPTKRKLILTS